MKKSSLLKAWLLTLLMTSFILLLHLNNHFSSMLHLNTDKAKQGIISDEYLPIAVDYHKSLFDFAKRPVTTFLIETASSGLQIGIGDAFVMVNFFFLLCNGLLIYILSVRHFCTHNNALFNLVFYYLSYSVLFSFFPPVYSYDEPAQYFFMFGMLICYFEKQWLIFIVFAFMSLLARETSALIMFGLFLYHWSNSSVNKRDVLCFGVPLVLYFLFLVYFISSHSYLETFKTDSKVRSTAFRENFANTAAIIESLFSVVNAALIPLFFLYKIRKKSMDGKFLKWRNIIIFIFVLNTVICLLFTLARETRLFNLPFVLFYPLSYIIIDHIKSVCSLKGVKEQLRRWQFWFLAICGLLLAYLVSFKIFRTIEGGSSNLFNEYNFIIVAGIIFFIIFAAADKNRIKGENI